MNPITKAVPPATTPTPPPKIQKLNLYRHLLSIPLPPRHRLPRLLNLLQHRLVAHFVGVHVRGLVFEVDGVGGKACVRVWR